MIITGTDLCVCPDINNDNNYNITGTDLCICLDINNNGNHNSRSEHTGQQRIQKYIIRNEFELKE
jgi:hypothetical protein